MKRIISACVLIILVALYSAVFAQSLLTGEARIYYNKGVRAQKAGDFEAAYTLYQKAMLLNPAFQEPAVNNLGVIFIYRGDWDQAKKSFSEVLRANPNYKPALFNLGLLHYVRGDEREALNYWIRYMEIGDKGFRSFMIEDEIAEESGKN